MRMGSGQWVVWEWAVVRDDGYGIPVAGYGMCKHKHKQKALPQDKTERQPYNLPF